MSPPTCTDSLEGHQEAGKAGSSREEGGQSGEDFSLDTNQNSWKWINESADYDDLGLILWVYPHSCVCPWQGLWHTTGPKAARVLQNSELESGR